jgi:hypothetical protein
MAIGPRTSTIALIAAAIERNAIGSLEVRNALPSLKELIEQNHVVNDMPELFCQDLLGYFDVKDIVTLVAPRPVRGL